MKPTKRRTIKVKARITVETSFASYNSPALDERALDQIKSWLTEVLEEEPCIPLFITTQEGEETGPKKVDVSVSRVGKEP